MYWGRNVVNQLNNCICCISIIQTFTVIFIDYRWLLFSMFGLLILIYKSLPKPTIWQMRPHLVLRQFSNQETKNQYFPSSKNTHVYLIGTNVNTFFYCLCFTPCKLIKNIQTRIFYALIEQLIFLLLVDCVDTFRG